MITRLGGRFDYRHKTHLAGEMLTISYMLAATRKHDIQRRNIQIRSNILFLKHVAFHQDDHERFTSTLSDRLCALRHHTLEKPSIYFGQ